MVDAAVDHGGGLDVLISNAGNMYRGAIDELDAAMRDVDVVHRTRQALLGRS